MTPAAVNREIVLELGATNYLLTQLLRVGIMHASTAAAHMANDVEHDFAPIGMVGVDWRHEDAPELGYWLGVDHWGRGFATEAARAVIDFTFEEFQVDQLVSGAPDEGISYEYVAGLLGLTDSTLLDDTVEAFAAADPASVFRIVDRVVEAGHDPRRFTEDLLETWIDWKRTNEVDPIRLRPHPHEFELYFDI